MTLSLQFVSLLWMTLSGMLIGAIIEGTRFTLESTPRRSFLFKYQKFVEIIIWIGLGIGTFYILYVVRDGVWRIYDPLAQIVGILLYEQFLQPVFRLVGRIILRLFIQPIWFLFLLIITIISKILRLIVVIVTTLLYPILYPFKKIWHLALQKKVNFRYNKNKIKNKIKK